MNILEEYNLKLQSLVVFRNLLEDTTMQKFVSLLNAPEHQTAKQIQAYSEFVAKLYKRNDNFTKFLLTRLLEDENAYITKHAQNKQVSDIMEKCVENELQVLQDISRITPEQVHKCIAYKGFLPVWENSDIDFSVEYKKRLEHISDFGYGIFAKYYMFIIKDSAITPVKSPDDTSLSNLIGYKNERQSVIDNTVALLEGKPAANALLYGDAGTGKSSTVKAVVNEYKDHGLRLIEIAKSQLRDIPTIIDSLSKNPLKFILFIDDLSFSKDDDDFGALKAILEGSVSARTSNIVIYATSNRRHLVKETFSDRDGDEVHRNDTMQELISLSERFGLTVNFSKPNKNQYIDIIHGLAKQYGIEMPIDQLDLEAEAFAIHRSGRSPRLAKQFIEHLMAKESNTTIEIK